MKFYRLMEALQQRRFAQGTVNFSKSQFTDPHIAQCVAAIANAEGTTPQAIEDEIKIELSKLQNLATRAPILYGTLAGNGIEDRVFTRFMDAEIKTGAPEFEKLEFFNLMRTIQGEHDEFWPLRSFIERRPLKADWQFVNLPMKTDGMATPGVTTAAATPGGTFIFNRVFMQKLMDYAHIKQVKPKGRKYVSNGGTIPDEYAYIEFLIMHELMHYTNDDFYYQKVIPNANPMIINWVGDFRSNYLLVKSGYEQLPMGLFNDEINYDRQKTYREMYDLVASEFARLNEEEQKQVQKEMDEKSDDHTPGQEEGAKSDVNEDSPPEGDGDDEGEGEPGEGEGEPGEGEGDQPGEGEGEGGDQEGEGQGKGKGKGKGKPGKGGKGSGSGEPGEEGDQEGEGEGGEGGQEGQPGAGGEEGSESGEDGDGDGDEDGDGQGNGKKPGKEKGKGKGQGEEPGDEEGDDGEDGNGPAAKNNKKQGKSPRMTPEDIDRQAHQTQRQMEKASDKTSDEANAGNRAKQKAEQDGKSAANGSPGAGRDGKPGEIDWSKIRPTFDWKTLVKRFLASAKPGMEETYARPARRSVSQMDVARQLGSSAIKPGVKMSDAMDSKLGFCFDASGSMSGIIGTVFANAVKLLSTPAFKNSESIVARFSGDFTLYKVLFAQNKATVVQSFKDKPKNYELKTHAVFNRAESGGTVFGPQLAAKMIEGIKDKWNIIFFLDSDIMWGGNYTHFMEVVKAGPKQVYVVFASRDDYILFRKTSGITTANITYFG